MITETVSRLVTNQVPPVMPAQHVIVCDLANRDLLAAVAQFLQTTSLVPADANVQLVPLAICASAKVQALLEADQLAGRISFALIQDSLCRRYFKTKDQADFSVHLTAA